MNLKWRGPDHTRVLIKDVKGKFEKVPKGIRGEKSSKDMASLRNLVSTIWAQASPRGGGGVRKGMRSLLARHTRECQVRYQGHEIGWKSDWLGSHC